MEQGPVLILTFQAQQVTMVTDKRGKIVEGAVVGIIWYWVFGNYLSIAFLQA